MTSFVKRELLKHLTRFAKNVDPAKINISAYRGEGELNGLELDEQVLMGLLELPTWLNIKSAKCNRLTIKIPWTSLKSKPIGIYLDCVSVDMETCEDLRRGNSAGSNVGAGAAGGESAKYGFVERVVDGIYVHVSSVLISFKSYAFSADIDLSQIGVESVSPSWDRTEDLRKTRVKDETRDQVIIFKRIQLGVIRIALNALDAHDAPILLISNNSEVQVAIKKRLNDCGFVASKVKFIIEDLLWVLNDSQIKAVVSYINMLKPLIMKAHKASQLNSGGATSSEQEHMKVASANSHGGGSNYTSATSFRLPKNDTEIKMCKLFDLNDIHETSYHLVCRRIDLHLVEDNSKRANSVPLRLEGGALQLSLRNLCFDHYPYHLVGQTFYHWENYSDLFEARNTWANQLITHFKEQYLRLKSEGKIDDLVATELNFYGTNPVSIEARSRKKKPGSMQTLPTFVPQRLMSSCFVLFLDSYALHHVTSNKTSGSEVMNGKLIYSDKSTFHIPADVPSLLAIYTDYYFTYASPSIVTQPQPGGSGAKGPPSSGGRKRTEVSAAVHSLQSEIQQLPLPHANLHVKFNPFCVDFDPNTLIWLNAFAKRVSKSVDLERVGVQPYQQMPEGSSTETVMHVDLKADFLMPQIKLTLEKHPEDQPDRPRGIEIALSSASMSNVHDRSKVERGKLLGDICETYAADKKTSFKIHPLELDTNFHEYFPSTIKPASCKGANMMRYPGFLDTVVIDIDQAWSDWFGIKTTKLGRLPLVDPVSFSMFVSYPQLQKLVQIGNSLASQTSERNSRSSFSNGSWHGQVGNSLTANNNLNNNEQVPPNVNQVTPDLLKGCKKSSLSSSTNYTSIPHPLDAEYTERSDPLIQIMFTSKKRVTLYLDHYQFIVLMRLQEMVLKTLEIMEQDTKLILGDQLAQQLGHKEMKLSFIGIFPSLDIVFLLPPQPESADVIASRRSLLLSATHEFVAAESSNLNIEAVEIKSESELSNSKHHLAAANDEEFEACSTTGGGDQKMSDVNSEDAESLVNAPPNFCSEQITSLPVITIHTQDSGATFASNSDSTEQPVFRKSMSGSDRPMANNSSSGYSTTSSVKGSVGGNKVTLSSLSSAAGNLSAKFSSAGSLMGKTFTDTMSITGSEFSIGSGGYSSEDDFICLSAEGGSLSKATNVGPKVVDYDQELKPLNTYKPDEEFLGEERNDMPVTIMVARMQGVEASVQLLGDSGSSVVHVALPALDIEDHPNTTFSKFLTINAKYDREYASTIESHPQLVPAKPAMPLIEARIDSPGVVSKELYGGVCEQRGHLAVNIQKLKLGLKMTNVLAMIDLIEDELILPVPPLDLVATESEINIAQDGPPSNPLTSPPPVPLNLKLHGLKLLRDGDNVMNLGIQPIEPDRRLNSLSESVVIRERELVTRNTDLEQQLQFVRRQLDEALQENTALQRTLTNMQNSLLPPTTPHNHGFVVNGNNSSPTHK